MPHPRATLALVLVLVLVAGAFATLAGVADVRTVTPAPASCAPVTGTPGAMVAGSSRSLWHSQAIAPSAWLRALDARRSLGSASALAAGDDRERAAFATRNQPLLI